MKSHFRLVQHPGAEDVRIGQRKIPVSAVQDSRKARPSRTAQVRSREGCVLIVVGPEKFSRKGVVFIVQKVGIGNELVFVERTRTAESRRTVWRLRSWDQKLPVEKFHLHQRERL